MDKDLQPEVNYRIAAKACNKLHFRMIEEFGLQAEYEAARDECNRTFKIWQDSDPDNLAFSYYKKG